jgi:hypothetical protein
MVINDFEVFHATLLQENGLIRDGELKVRING